MAQTKDKELLDKEEAMFIARDIIHRLLKGKCSLKDEMCTIFNLKDDKTGETTLYYLKDIRKLIEELIDKIERKL